MADHENHKGRRTPFSIGRRWRCMRGPVDPERCREFDFVIIGPATEIDTATASERYKRCRLECRSKELHGDTRFCCNGREQDYSHAHLKRHAQLVEDDR